jgi:hypothetical protein
MTLDYKARTPPTTTRHDHIYTTLLGVLAMLLVMAMLTLNAMRLGPAMDSAGRSILLVPLAVEGCYVAAIVVVLLIRIAFPASRRWPTLGLNIMLLLFIPIGTALAVYGFWKVDKNLPRESN